MGFTISFFILAMFNESWILSSLIYAPALTFYMSKTGSDLLGSESQELVIRCLFCIVIYMLIAYRIEILTK